MAKLTETASVLTECNVGSRKKRKKKEDLSAINKLTLTEQEADDVFVFSAIAVSDTPTSNRNQYTAQFQESIADRWVGRFGLGVYLNFIWRKGVVSST